MNTNLMLTGRIGGSVIVNEDINKFFDQIKDLDWTDNNIYKPAKIVDVKPTFSVNLNSHNQGHFQSKLGFFDQFLIEDNSNHLNDFKTYKNDVENKLIRSTDRIITQKDEFLQSIKLEGIDDSAKKSQILEAIKQNLSFIVNNNSKLKEKIGSLVNSIETQNTQNNQGNYNNNSYNNMSSNNFNNNFNNNQMGRGNQYGYTHMNSFGNNQNQFNQQNQNLTNNQFNNPNFSNNQINSNFNFK
jgi:hypothetical protein